MLLFCAVCVCPVCVRVCVRVCVCMCARASGPSVRMPAHVRRHATCEHAPVRRHVRVCGPVNMHLGEHVHSDVICACACGCASVHL